MGWSSSTGKSSKKVGGVHVVHHDMRQVPNTTASSNSNSNSAAAGCMSALFHFFDFHHFQIPLNNHHHHHHHHTTNNNISTFQQQHHQVLDLTIPKGVEAPRNSLEINESPLKIMSNIQKNKMGIQIKTRPKVGDCSSENIICSSPSAKTPTLVARLMGLDLLPENTTTQSSPSTPNLQSKSTLHHKTRRQQQQQPPLRNRSSSLKTFMDNDMINSNFSGTRSLPETPRISLARRSSDSDNADYHHHYHHRLSLQINKENNNTINEENNIIELSRLSYLRRKYYHHQEESSRKVGLVDITNNIKSRERSINNNQSNCTSTSCSPRLRYLDNKNKTNMPTSITKDQTPKPPVNNLQSSQVISTVKVAPKPKQVVVQQVLKSKNNKVKANNNNNNNDKFGLCKKSSRNNKQEEPFVRAPTIINPHDHHHHNKKCKKTPLSSELLTSVPTLLHHVKKDPSTKIPSKPVSTDVVAQESKQTIRSQLSSCPSHHNKPSPHISQDNNGYTTTTTTTATTTTSTVDGGAELKSYVTKILKCTGINKHTLLSLSLITNFQFSPSQPINPSIFNYLEKLGLGLGFDLGLKCNRRLTFNLVNEVLVHWINNNNSKEVINGSDLVEILCTKIKGFPLADCQVLEDIDALINGDWTPLKCQNEEAFESEGDGIVTDIERQILESLIHETVSF
ncbi:hypothetical protein ACFE04_028599 [Oxalis oulophora]